MAGYNGLREYVDALNAGQSLFATWRKSPSQATTSGTWFDLSMSPGNPVPNYYASSPAVAAVLNGGEGIYHGGAVSPAIKRLKSVTALTVTATALPLTMILCDYLLYYPFMDMGTNDEQSMTNGVTLPRYADGSGVQVMAVMTNPQVTGGATFSFTYTNQAGEAGRVSQIVTCGTTTAIGNLVNSTTGAGGGQHFIGLQIGDTGVRSIEAFRMNAGSDVGLICLVLVKPLATHTIRETTAAHERDFLIDFMSMPRIYDGAYLNWICMPSGTLAATALHGDITVAWN